jgi:putative SOS response-associated peptidase YedK
MAMCGRYSLGKKPKEWPEEQLLFRPRYNVAPSQDCPVCLSNNPMRMMRWGLVPRWSADDRGGSRMINARAETLTEKPAFRWRVREGRCAVPADSFFEWRRDGSRKRPFRFLLRDEQPFFFAGLWDTWKARDGKTLETFTIITTEANALVRDVHDRMPVILVDSDARQWLANGPLQLLTPLAAEMMESYAVSPRLNDPLIDDPQCIQHDETGEPMLPGFDKRE